MSFHTTILHTSIKIAIFKKLKNIIKFFIKRFRKIVNEEIKLDLDYKSSLYLYLLKIQDEVHRYAITFFRNRKQTSLLRSKLNEIKGIGNITINKLIKYYENITNIKNAPEEELAQYIGLKNAKLIKNELK